MTAINLDLPPTLEQVVQRCLNKQPEGRFQTASDLGFAIETIDPDNIDDFTVTQANLDSLGLSCQTDSLSSERTNSEYLLRSSS